MKSPRIQVILPATIHADVEKIAKSVPTSISDAARHMILWAMREEFTRNRKGSSIFPEVMVRMASGK